MYKIFADKTLIYDSSLEDYKIGKGSITLETNKSGSFSFSVYPDHFFYDKFVRLRTVITVYKSGKIVFRGRILNDVSDHWNNKVITCEGELGFLQDSIIRPFEFTGTPEELFKQFITAHNLDVDTFKQFKIGKVTVVDPNGNITRSNDTYESTLTNLNKGLLEDTLGRYLYITHGEDGTEEIPTLNYLADFTKVSSQMVEFGVNLKNYTKTVTANDIATVIIPLGADISEGNKLTIANINEGKDYVCHDDAVALYGRITKVMIWDEEFSAENLKRKAEEYLRESINQNITIELTAIDLHLLDRSIESFNVGDYIRVRSVPHNFDSVMLCNKQTIDLLKPENDSLTLGYTYTTFVEKNSKIDVFVTKIPDIQKTVGRVNSRVAELSEIAQNASDQASKVESSLGTVTGDVEAVAGVATENARSIATNAKNITTNATNIATNATNIEKNTGDILKIITRLEKLENG